MIVHQPRLWIFLAGSAITAASGWAEAAPPSAGPAVGIVVPQKASTLEKIAAGELADYLARLYPGERFTVTEDRARPGAAAIYLGTPDSAPDLARLLGDRVPREPEGYVVRSAVVDGRPAGVIVGADPRGVTGGVYGLLRKLGCGFYLSYDALPKPRDGRFSTEGWDLADHPLVAERIMFNWHNFLSGCSTWNLADWQAWVRQSQKAGYNAIMVHAYGNNPMAGFAFNGVYKPVGYLASTRLGRDWDTNHVGDVRRLWGGELFDRPVFGADAAIGGDDRQRTEAAQRLMRSVFQCAAERGMKVHLAIDVDTFSANSQEIIRLVPEEGRFAITPSGRSRKMWLANPESPDGYRYFKAQVEHWLRAYPQVSSLVVWFRHGDTPWAALREEDLPPAWQRQYREEIAKTPGAEKLWRSVGMFSIAKIVTAYRRALHELGRKDVEVGVGTWRFDILPAADRFMPPGVTLTLLDYKVLNNRSQLDTAEKRAEIARVGARRPVVPIVWAHHDDGSYFGRSYVPYPQFHEKLREAKAAGFGVMHWMTRPLDLYCESLARQVRVASCDEPLERTCRDMAGRCFGPQHAEVLGRYLQQWATEAPQVGRETRAMFINQKTADPARVAEGMKRRMALLDSVAPQTLDPPARDRLNYFRGLEQFLLDVHQAESAQTRAKRAYEKGDLAAARRAAAEANPEQALRRFAAFAPLGGITRGEQGLLVTLHTRWLSHYLRLRQQLGLEPIRYNYRATVHEPLAQNGGKLTFDFGPEHEIWECLGARETGAEPFSLPPETKLDGPADLPAFYKEVCRTGIESSRPLKLLMQPIMGEGGRSRLPKPGPLPAGRYTLTLLFVESPGDAGAKRVFDVGVELQGAKAAVKPQRVTLEGRPGGTSRVVVLRQAIELTDPARVHVTLTPVQGKALVCGAVLAGSSNK